MIEFHKLKILTSDELYLFPVVKLYFFNLFLGLFTLLLAILSFILIKQLQLIFVYFNAIINLSYILHFLKFTVSLLTLSKFVCFLSKLDKLMAFVILFEPLKY